ncbi:hypothetical protein L3V83_12345 [Thiotrichales bacterium 19X7-9]|nr:hypothetical protein [Thiotrichales bacterium 19X7-9]
MSNCVYAHIWKLTITNDTNTVYMAGAFKKVPNGYNNGGEPFSWVTPSKYWEMSQLVKTFNQRKKLSPGKSMTFTIIYDGNHFIRSSIWLYLKALSAESGDVGVSLYESGYNSCDFSWNYQNISNIAVSGSDSCKKGYNSTQIVNVVIHPNGYPFAKGKINAIGIGQVNLTACGRNLYPAPDGTLYLMCHYSDSVIIDARFTKMLGYCKIEINTKNNSDDITDIQCSQDNIGYAYLNDKVYFLCQETMGNDGKCPWVLNRHLHNQYASIFNYQA